VSVDGDDIRGRGLIGVHGLDYRYRFGQSPVAFRVFAGAARYVVGTPAYGFYFGGGPEWRDVLPGWDLGLQYRRVVNAERIRDLPSDPQGGTRNDSFTNIYALGLSVSRKF
jgi:hypothetical protein